MILRMFRRIYRLIGISLWTLYVAARVSPSLFGKDFRSILRCSRMTQIWTAGLSRIIGIRVQAKHPEFAPQSTGGFVISNHLSYLDVLVHATLTPVRFAPKIELKSWPIIGWVVGLSRPVWIDRENRQKSAEMKRQFQETLSNGISMLVYPEGTTTDGSHLLDFKSPPFEAPIEVGATIHPIITRYHLPQNGKTLCWYGDMSLIPHLWMAFGLPHIDVEIEWLPPETLLPGMNRKAVAVAIRDRMENELRRIEAEAGGSLV